MMYSRLRGHFWAWMLYPESALAGLLRNTQVLCCRRNLRAWADDILGSFPRERRMYCSNVLYQIHCLWRRVLFPFDYYSTNGFTGPGLTSSSYRAARDVLPDGSTDLQMLTSEFCDQISLSTWQRGASLVFIERFAVGEVGWQHIWSSVFA